MMIGGCFMHLQLDAALKKMIIFTQNLKILNEL